MQTKMKTRTMLGGAAVFLLVALLPACRKSRVVIPASISTSPAPAAAARAIAPGDFVTNDEGTWEYESEEGVVRLTVSLRGPGNRWGALSWGLESSGQSCGETVALLNPNDPWFVYLEGPRSVWVYDGQETVYRVILNPDGSSTQSMARGTIEFRFAPGTAAPQAVLDRLPKNMQGLFQVAPPPPPPPPKKVRPSI